MTIIFLGTSQDDMMEISTDADGNQALIQVSDEDKKRLELGKGCSPSAAAQMRALANEHNLNFTFNMGGGEYYREGGFRCQISTVDDEYDLGKLKEALGLA